jgi:hypothetical protein
MESGRAVADWRVAVYGTNCGRCGAHIAAGTLLCLVTPLRRQRCTACAAALGLTPATSLAEANRTEAGADARSNATTREIIGWTRLADQMPRTLLDFEKARTTE